MPAGMQVNSMRGLPVPYGSDGLKGNQIMKYPKINLLPGARPKKKQRSIAGGVRLPSLNS